MPKAQAPKRQPLPEGAPIDQSVLAKATSLPPPVKSREQVDAERTIVTNVMTYAPGTMWDSESEDWPEDAPRKQSELAPGERLVLMPGPGGTLPHSYRIDR